MKNIGKTSHIYALAAHSTLQMDFKTIKKRLESFIQVRSTDSVSTHLKQIFLSVNEEKICGSATSDEIKVWTSSNQVIGFFYPVVLLKFNKQQNKVILKSKINIVGLALALCINIGIVWASLDMFILREGLSVDSIVQRFLVFVMFIGILNFPIYMSYKGARDVIMKEIEDKVKNVSAANNALVK